MSTIDRKLATVQRIIDISPIPGADSIEVATVKGWKVVVKKDEFQVNDLVVYLEIDSWVPTEIAPFLSKGNEPKEYKGVKGERLRTIKLRKQISQGLILPISVLDVSDTLILEEGWDVSERLGIIKWEQEIPAQLRGLIKGNFPSFIPKTDQERIQNLGKELEEWKLQDHTWEVTEKLEGSSFTAYFNNNEFGVCSRNLDLKCDENNAFWVIAIKKDLENKLRQLGKNLAIQGELCGIGIQGNHYELKENDVFVFDIFDIDEQKYLSGIERLEIANKLELNHVPVLSVSKLDSNATIESLLEFADGKSLVNTKKNREGLVYKSITDPSVSFKTVSNLYLVNEK